MPTPKKGTRLGGSAHHQKHILSNLAAQLFEHGAIKTTDAKAKMLRPYAEKLINRAKSGTLADRRLVATHLPQKDVVAYLFTELAPKFENRDGGYTRSIKLENRKGDNAPMTQISLVLEETVSTEATRATRAAAAKAQAAEAEAAKAAEAEAAEAEAEEAPAEEAEAEEPKAEEAQAEEAPAEEVQAEEPKAEEAQAEPAESEEAEEKTVEVTPEAAAAGVVGDDDTKEEDK